jgi:hypothetical protein
MLDYLMPINNEGCTIRNALFGMAGNEAGRPIAPLPVQRSIRWLAFIVQVHYINGIDWIYR